MTTFGPIALLGGGEHLPPCEPGDRKLLELVAACSPRVTVIPAASGRRQLPRTAGLARDHWRRLGAAVSTVEPGTSPDESLELIETADVIVLPGGHPNRLMQRLAPSPLLELILARWSNGAGLAGSSAGAMCLFQQRLRLYPPNPLGLLPGLAFLDGFIVAPHFDRFRARHWATRACRFLPSRQVLGIDENTSLVGHLSSLRVYGIGGVVVASHNRSSEFPTGTELPTDLITPHAGFAWCPPQGSNQ